MCRSKKLNSNVLNCITAKELMLDVDSIIKKYEEATKIKGLMAL